MKLIVLLVMYSISVATVVASGTGVSIDCDPVSRVFSIDCDPVTRVFSVDGDPVNRVADNGGVAARAATLRALPSNVNEARPGHSVPIRIVHPVALAEGPADRVGVVDELGEVVDRGVAEDAVVGAEALVAGDRGGVEGPTADTHRERVGRGYGSVRNSNRDEDENKKAHFLVLYSI